MTDDLVRRLRDAADEVEAFPHPSHCDHLHVAHKLMRQAADALEAAQKDAERYRWLRSRIDSRHGPFVGYTQRGFVSQMTHDNADMLIDAAIDAAKEKP